MGFIRNNYSKIKETVSFIESKNNVLNLTKDRYQLVNIMEDTTIVLPDVKDFTRIHLFFTVENDLEIMFPQVKYQMQPKIVVDKSYEIIFTYTDKWLMSFIEYGQEASDYETYNGYPLNILNERISEEYSSYILEIQGNTVDKSNLGEVKGDEYVIKFNVSTSEVEFGKGGKIE